MPAECSHDSVLGATYGGNGRVNFALPDLRRQWPAIAISSLGFANVTANVTSNVVVANNNIVVVTIDAGDVTNSQ